MAISRMTPKEAGNAGEARALAYLLKNGLTLVRRNYRVARGPSARAAEIDLIMSDRDGTLVFIEVRARSGVSHGGAAASIGVGKRRAIVFAAHHYLQRLASLPACRFDVIAIDAEDIHWLRAAFDADCAGP